MRGKQALSEDGGFARGLIPAHAGKTARRRRTLRSRRAHPRSRGENMWNVSKSRGCRGSSPLTRGKRAGLGRFSLAFRLIPTHAGKTNPSPGAVSRRTAHPRSRGENTRYWWVTSRRGGSSPLTRGKRHGRNTRLLHLGLIPAHVGKTRRLRRSWRRSWAHPRSRGENVVADTKKFSRAGSSPLTRGKLPGVGIPERRLRLIPAHAGKTSSLAS